MGLEYFDKFPFSVIAMLNFLPSEAQKVAALETLYQFTIDANDHPATVEAPKSGDPQVDASLFPLFARACNCAHKHARNSSGHDDGNTSGKKPTKSAPKPHADTTTTSTATEKAKATTTTTSTTTPTPTKPFVSEAEFISMAHRVAIAINREPRFDEARVKALWRELNNNNWRYRGYSFAKCMMVHSNSDVCNESAFKSHHEFNERYYCGLYGLIYFELFSMPKMRDIFNAVLDEISTWGGDDESLCDAFDFMEELKLDLGTCDDEIQRTTISGNKKTITNYKSVADYIAAIKAEHDKA